MGRLMLTVQVIGTEEVRARFDAMPGKVHDALAATISSLALQLQKHVQVDKLEGQVLRHITGQLQGSIHGELSENSSDRITGRVYSSNVAYAAIHEYGGPFRTRLGTGKGPPKPGGKAVAQMPERSFLRSSLADYRQKIIDDMSAAVRQAVRA
jgi:phage gpG-like protein